MNPEVFYLHIAGEQRGPYTIPQIDHLLNSGLISEDALYWREGMEQWQPVTNVVRLRRPTRKRSWTRRVVFAVLLVVALLLGRIFGPVAMDGWRENAQYEYTPRAAYWRARDIVRREAAPPGAAIAFAPLKKARVQLAEPPTGATVWLPAEVAAARGMRPAAWEVQLKYDPKLKQWSGVSVKQTVK